MLRLEALDATIARMRRLMDTGCWPSGVRMTYLEARTVEWNLEVALVERDTLRRELRP